MSWMCATHECAFPKPGFLRFKNRHTFFVVLTGNRLNFIFCKKRGVKIEYFQENYVQVQKMGPKTQNFKFEAKFIYNGYTYDSYDLWNSALESAKGFLHLYCESFFPSVRSREVLGWLMEKVKKKFDILERPNREPLRFCFSSDETYL